MAEEGFRDLGHLLVGARQVVDPRAGSRSKPSSSISSRARRRIAPDFRTPALDASRPRKRFSSTVRLGTSENSWNTGLMPIWRARCGDRRPISSPLKRKEPASGGKVPEMTLISVDLPAPVLAEEDMELARAHVEIDAVEGEDAREALGDAGQAEQGLRVSGGRGGSLHAVLHVRAGPTSP